MSKYYTKWTDINEKMFITQYIYLDDENVEHVLSESIGEKLDKVYTG